VLLSLAVMFVALSIGATVTRSLIPARLDGRVTAIELHHVKHPGVDDVWLVTVDKQRLHVDAAVAEQLSRDARVRTAAWSSRLTVDDRDIRLRLSDDARGMLLVMPLTLAVAVVSLRLGARGGPA
jgi:hypothetical protein